MRYDLTELPNWLEIEHIILARQLAKSDAGRALAADLARSDAGRALAQDLAGSTLGRGLAQALTKSDDGRALAQDLAGSHAGRALAQDLAGSHAGRALAQDLAGSDAGRALAQDLAGSDAGRDLIQHLARNAPGRALAQDLAGSRAGRAFAQDLAGSDAGRELARDLAGTDAGLRLFWSDGGPGSARALAGSVTGRALAQTLARNATGRELACDLAESAAGRELARELVGSDASRELARDLAGSYAGRALAADLARSDASRELAQTLARNATGRELARELAGSDAGRELARDLAGSAAGRALAKDLAESDAHGLEGELLAVAVLSLLAFGVVVPFAVAILAIPAGVACTVLFLAGALTHVNDAGSPDEVAKNDEDRDGSEGDDHRGRGTEVDGHHSHDTEGDGRHGDGSRGEVDSSRVWSIDELYELERVVGRLDTATADRVRARLEPFVGQLEQLLASGRYPEGEISDQVEYELRQLRRELFSENPVEPLGNVVYAYFTSLLRATRPLLNEPELRAAAERHGLDEETIVELVEAGTHEASDRTDVTPAVDIGNRTKALAPTEIASDRSRTEWAATVIGWVSDTAIKGGAVGGASGAAATQLNLTWLSPLWAAVIGGVIGIASTIAKIVVRELDAGPPHASAGADNES